MNETLATRDCTAADWVKNRIKQDEIDKYLNPDGTDFIPDEKIEQLIADTTEPSTQQVKDILAKSLEIKTLSPEETACLMRVKDPEMVALMEETAAKIKKKVYDNRIVTFAPLYLGNACVNNCLYCGFRNENEAISRRVLKTEEIRREAELLAGTIGHKRLIVVYGEHPSTDVNYMIDSIKTIYSVKAKTKNGFGQIRRINVNASPMQVEELRQLKQAGLGTYQVFQETYHRKRYAKLHPSNTLKGNYRWRLYCMHRAMEAGIDDVGIGPLFGLSDWKFEMLAMVYHAHELEDKFGIGPHTVSFPRMEDAENTPFAQNSKYIVNDADFRRILTVVRLSIPYTGMILTARESPENRRELMRLGCTQTDASSKIGIGCYSESNQDQESKKQQFILGDTRSLDEVIRELAQMGYITSFCTAGYRCGRTGDKIMGLLRSGKEGQFCKLNAVLTFREWLDDFASEETKKVGEALIAQELEEIKDQLPNSYPHVVEFYNRIKNGERDLYF